MGTVPLDGSVIVVWMAPPSGSGATVRVPRGGDQGLPPRVSGAVAPKTLKRGVEVRTSLCEETISAAV